MKIRLDYDGKDEAQEYLKTHFKMLIISFLANHFVTTMHKTRELKRSFLRFQLSYAVLVVLLLSFLLYSSSARILTTDNDGIALAIPNVNINNNTSASGTINTSSLKPLNHPPIATSDQSNIQISNNYTFVRKWGSQGTGDGQFNYPYAIDVDSSGNVYVADSKNMRIQKFDNNGNFISKWGSQGTGDGQFNYPSGVAVDSSGNVYVADYNNKRIQKYNSNGNLITELETTPISPDNIAIDPLGNVYLAAFTIIQKYDSNGNLITEWGSSGQGDGQFYAQAIAIDSSGNVYVADAGNDRIQKFDNNGNFISKWGSQGTGDGQFNIPYSIAIDSSDNVYVADFDNYRIQIFAPSR
jgi:outer membrane protein assembly factor BamB